jgi:hypothetical protein
VEGGGCERNTMHRRQPYERGGAWPEDTPSGATLILVSTRASGSCPLGGTASDDATSVPGSFNIVDLGAGVLGLSGYPRALPLPTS